MISLSWFFFYPGRFFRGERLLPNLWFFTDSDRRFGTGHMIHPLISKGNSCLINFISEGFDILFCLQFFLREDIYLFFKGFLQIAYKFELLFKILNLESAIVFLTLLLISYRTKF